MPSGPARCQLNTPDMSLARALRSGSKDVVGRVADHLSPAVAKFAVSPAAHSIPTVVRARGKPLHAWS